MITGELAGKVAFVTGAGSGIGRASALAVAHAGARVVVSDIDAVRGGDTVHAIQSAGGEAVFFRADVSVTADVAALVSNTVEAFGQLDCAHNNAGIEGPRAPLHEYTEDAWDRVLAVNLKGIWLCMQHEIRQMLQQGGGGTIVNTAPWPG